MIAAEKANAIAERLLHSNGIKESVRMVSNSLEDNRRDFLGFIDAGRTVDARRAEEAMFRDKEVLRILRDWEEA